MYRLRLIAMLSIALLLGACASPLRTSLTPEQRGKVTELTAHVVVVQDEVIAAVQPSTAGAANGLIGAMIDSHITNNRVKESQSALGPFYAAIEDVDYRKEFNESIQKELSAYPIKISRFTTTPRFVSKDELARLRSDLQPGQALLVILPRYTLSMDFRTFDVESMVGIWLRPGESDSQMPSQCGQIRYQSAPVGPGDRESLALWAAQGAAPFRNAMRESIAETVRMVMLDIDVAAKAPDEKNLQTFPFNQGMGKGEIKGQVLKTGNGRAILLGSDMKLYSLPHSGSLATTAQQ
ncbi:hypothetical protein SAMN04489708_12171 [Paracidovorax cattleyae]|uniref:Defect in organelle trafficking protein DotC n=2 Tax=Paracidovorax cattleyae TaxID=80868 RepID=A0A1H0USA5_9BURK|nr:hypothetical protein [Paracidovorax cattleyae]SDP68965.1 hypothetical protein SAMN04489708_12171 [Paracidovorax cattleyae]